MYTKCISNKKFTIWTLTTCHTTYEGKTNTTKPPDTVRTPGRAPKLFFLWGGVPMSGKIREHAGPTTQINMIMLWTSNCCFHKKGPSGSGFGTYRVRKPFLRNAKNFCFAKLFGSETPREQTLMNNSPAPARFSFWSRSGNIVFLANLQSGHVVHKTLRVSKLNCFLNTRVLSVSLETFTMPSI